MTPTHQSPLGVALSLPRRLALLAWAAEAGAWVLEDDYDSEFRYTGHPLPALKSLDRGGRVLYAGSFSKVLFPALRLGYLVVPDELAEAFAARRPAVAVRPAGAGAARGGGVHGGGALRPPPAPDALAVCGAAAAPWRRRWRRHSATA